MRILVGKLCVTLVSATVLLWATAALVGCGGDSNLFGDTHTTVGGAGGTGGTGGAGGTAGSTSVVKVAVMDGSNTTDELRTFLDGQPNIDADTLNSCILGELMAFDVIVVHSQMSCFENDDFNTYVVNGGGIIGVPWIHDYGEVSALPVTPDLVHKEMGAALEMFAVEPSDPLLDGVTFQAGEAVAYERGALPPRAGATVSARWGDSTNTSAVVRWSHGAGRGVYLNFVYTHSCCPTAVHYGWGQTLIRNAVHWAAGE